MAKVSVIIPLYNKEKYIERVLDSVLRQTYTDFEVIVVDDGSTDRGPEIVSNYGDSRIRLIYQENAGPGAARNLGTHHSRSELVTYLDADDEWLTEFLDKSVTILSDNPDCDAVASAFFIGPEKINRADQLRQHGISAGPWRLTLDITQDELNYALAVFHCCSSVFKRRVIEKYGGFYDKNNCSYGEDVYLWLQIMFNHRIYRNLQPLAWYHCENSQLGLSSGKAGYPLEPVFIDTEPLRKNCPAEYLPILQRWLANHALRAVRLNIDLADRYKAYYLLHSFPLIKKWKWEYCKLKVKMLLTQLIPYIRFLKRNIFFSRRTAV
jgi:glycosyltransferase involved in cell wall biosynthesis